MKKALLPFVLLSASAVQGQQTIPASVAKASLPKATFEDAHLAYTRIVLNESGWYSPADACGILEVLKIGSQPPKTALKAASIRLYNRENRTDIDYTRFVIRAAKASLRTFPIDDPWGKFVFEDRYKKNGIEAAEHHLDRQRKSINSYWTSTLKSDCSEPSHWKEIYIDPWSIYRDRCKDLFRMTSVYLKGEAPNWCRTLDGKPARPEYWGGSMDHPDKRWERLTCNEPGVDCSAFNEGEDPNNGSCAKNFWYRMP